MSTETKSMPIRHTFLVPKYKRRGKLIMMGCQLAGLLDKGAKCNTQGRIPWIDNMRGLLIFTVVLGHVISGENSFLTTAIGYTH